MENQITEIKFNAGGAGVRGAVKYLSNPFVDRLVVKTRTKKLTVAKGTLLVDSRTGEASGVTEITQFIEVDGGQFVKLFTKDLAIWFDFSRPALRVFGAILTTVQESAVGADILYFDFDSKNVKEFKLSKQSFYSGVGELIKKGIIARHKSPGLYYINPCIFFNGNRARFVKEYHRSFRDNVKRVAQDRDFVYDYEPEESS